MKNKLLTTALTASMLVPMASTSVFAANTSNPQTTTVKYKVEESYTWSVPAEVTFTSGALTQTSAAENGVKIITNVIASGQKLSIKISDDQQFTINANAEGKNDATLNYEVFKGSDTTGTKLAAGDEVLFANAGINSASTSMSYKLTTVSGEGKSEVAGEYTGTLAYTASVDLQN